MGKQINLLKGDKNKYSFQDISINLLEKEPELIVPLAKLLYEDIKSTTANNTAYNPIMDLRRSGDVNELVQIILSNVKGLKGEEHNTLFMPSRGSVLLASVISYVLENESCCDKSFTVIARLLLKGLEKISGSSDISELDVLLQTTDPDLGQTYTYKNYKLFKIMCDKCFTEEMVCIDVLLMIRNFLHLFTSSSTVISDKYKKMEDVFRNDDFTIRIENRDINNPDSVVHGQFFIKPIIYFKNKEINKSLIGNCFTFELASPESIKLIDSILVKKSRPSDFATMSSMFRSLFSRDNINCNYRLGVYSEIQNTKDVVELFAQLNYSLDKLLSPDYLDNPLAYNILMNIIKQNEVKELVIAVS